jgi:hypothetical protein
MPKVFIIILNWNGWSDTMECLSSLNNIIYDNFEVILIDNGSKEKLPISNYQFPKLKITQIFNDLNLGFAAGNNQGMKMALEGGAEYVLLLNNDTAVEPDFLNRLVEASENNKEYGILGPVIYNYGTEKIQFAGGKINWSKTKGEHLTLFNAPQPPLNLRGGAGELYFTDYITGCCLLIKREVIEKIGLLSEDYFLYYEDTDWNMRARNAGWLCGVVPNAKIYHKASQSSQEFSYPYIYYHSRNGLIFASRFGSKFLTCLISGWIFVKQVIKMVVGYRRDWARPVMKGVIDFWWTKKGKLEGYY